VERHRALLEVLGEPGRIVHVGGHGTGYTVKLLVNLLWFGQAVATAEALLLGQRAGLILPYWNTPSRAALRPAEGKFAGQGPCVEPPGGIEPPTFSLPWRLGPPLASNSLTSRRGLPAGL
jgi:hypothetical protein